jgi:hypothetical protein
VTIGGVNAEVQYAGAVPGTIAALPRSTKVPEVTPGWFAGGSEDQRFREGNVTVAVVGELHSCSHAIVQ